MDPGNWATNRAGGSQFGYTLLFIVLLSNVVAMVVQHLALRLGVATDLDLAQICRYVGWNRWVNYALFAGAQVAIAATDMAEVIGAAIALNLLFGIPIWGGVLITGGDCLLLLLFESHTFRVVEGLIAALTLLISGVLVYELFASHPDWGLLVRGFLPSGPIFTNPAILYNAMGIFGATVMPHNLYFHSSLIQTRAYPRTEEGRRAAIRYGTIDSVLSLTVASFINIALLALSAAAFYYGTPPQRNVQDLATAYELLSPAVGSKAAAILFGIGLLASGQQSTITGTLAGQVVMSGFLDLHWRPVYQRLLTRLVAIVPAATVAAFMGVRGINTLLILSQVILSLQLYFAVIPLVYFTSLRSRMGVFVNPLWLILLSSFLALVIAALNVYLVVSGCINGLFGS
jgi:manganese transport protein